jgi:tetratricopeptide (TPR) repeat protein
MVITYCFRADNYRRWSRADIRTRNYSQAKHHLNDAESLLNEAHSLDKTDEHVYFNYREIYQNYAFLYRKLGDKETALNYYKKSVGKIFNDANKGNFKDLFARSYYNIATLFENNPERKKEEIIKIINKGLVNCTEKSRYYNLLKEMKEEYVNFNKDRQEGNLESFNPEKKVGRIKSKEKSYFFHISYFQDYIQPNRLLDKPNLKVSFYIKENEKPREDYLDLAVKIITLE